MSNQTNELKNMMASFFQMNTASTSGTGSLPSNTVANPKGELEAITTRSGLVLDRPTIPMPPPFINPEEDELVEQTLTDPKHGEFTIKNGNSKKRISTGKDGVVRILPPVSAAEIHAVEKERKARTILLMAIPKEHLRRFHGMDDAKEIWEASQDKDLEGNANLKKMQKAVLKQQFEAFSISSSKGLEKGYDRFQQLLSQLEAHGAEVSRGCKSQCSKRSLFHTARAALTRLSLVILVPTVLILLLLQTIFKKEKFLLVLLMKLFIHSLPKQSEDLDLLHEDLEQIDDVDIEEMDINWQIAMIAIRMKKFYKKTGRRRETHIREEETNHTLMAINSNTEKTTKLTNLLYTVDLQRRIEFKGVPHPLSGDYTPKPQKEIDDSLYVYGKKGPQKPEISDLDDNSTEHSTYQSNDNEGSCGNTSEHSSESESESISVPNEMSTSKSVITNEKVVSELQEDHPLKNMEETKAQGRKTHDLDPLVSLVQELVTPSKTVNASGEEQVKDISPYNSRSCIKSLQKVLKVQRNKKKRDRLNPFDAQSYTKEDWDTIRAKLEAIRINQGTWKLTQLKKLNFEEVKAEFEKLVKQLDTYFDDEDTQPTEEKIKEDKDDKPTKKTGKRRKQITRKGFHTDHDKDESEDSDEANEKNDSTPGTKIPINPVPVATKSPSISNYKIIKQGRKGVYQIIRENGTDMVYISFGAMLTDISRDDLIELYRIVMKKHGIARDVFVLVGKFTFPADFVIVDYESDPRVLLILGKPFLRTARALIDVHRQEMTEEFEAYLTSDSFPSGNSNPSSLLPPFHNSLSGSTTSSSPSLHIFETSEYFHEEFGDELALITFPLGNGDLSFDVESDL
ncbi:ribonuclease H-like domain-containing protein, partial [Tanacetum coccineum]